MNRKAVVVVSGGLDSTTLAAYVKDNGYDVYGISFDYGQRHVKELKYATRQFQLQKWSEHKTVDMSSINGLFAESGSSLVTDDDVPEGHYGADNMKKTVVPNRNMIMLSIAGGYAVSVGAEIVATGVHAGDHFIYPDCRPTFIRHCGLALRTGNEGFGNPDLHIAAPFIQKTKNDIAQLAVNLGVEVDVTWSCYKGTDLHCGRCGTCVERREALESVPNFTDPTEYLDPHYWKQVV